MSLPGSCTSSRYLCVKLPPQRARQSALAKRVGSCVSAKTSSPCVVASSVVRGVHL